MLNMEVMVDRMDRLDKEDIVDRVKKKWTTKLSLTTTPS